MAASPSTPVNPSLGPTTLISPQGMLGRAWVNLLDQRGIGYTPIARPMIDLANPSTIAPAIPPSTQTVINCAAYTAVDDCETHEADATAVNGTGVAALAAHCNAIGARLVHYSTDYVFNGQADQPYSVDHPRDPVNAYGRSKAVGEVGIEAANAMDGSNGRHLNIRTSWLYAPWGGNFVRTMAKLTRDREQLKVVDDQRGRPTSCETLAAATLAMLEASGDDGQGVPGGNYHLTDGGDCTWHGFTVEIAKRCGHDCDIEPCTSDAFPRPAARPAYSVLDLSQSEAVIGPIDDWRIPLADVIARLAPLD
jgi:dTDP-4-dehydrorhamnose reductase